MLQRAILPDQCWYLFLPLSGTRPRPDVPEVGPALGRAVEPGQLAILEQLHPENLRGSIRI